MSLWESYRHISPRTRLIIGAGIMAYAGAGMLLSDTLEGVLGYTPTQEDKERLKQAVPTVRVVEKE